MLLLEKRLIRQNILEGVLNNLILITEKYEFKYICSKSLLQANIQVLQRTIFKF